MEVDRSTWGGEDDGTKGDDWFGGVDGDISRGADQSVVVVVHCFGFCSVIWNEGKVDRLHLREILKVINVKRVVGLSAFIDKLNREGYVV